MNQIIANWMFVIGYSSIATAFVLKFILWIRLRSKKRIGFLMSFVAFFSKMDIHDAETEQSKTFLNWSNVLNIVFWVGAVFLMIGFVMDPIALDTPIEPTRPVRR